MNKKIILGLAMAAAFAISTNRVSAQGMAINTTGSAADGSAMLDVSSTTQGVLVPRMTSAQRAAISSPATGLLVYQSDGTAGFYFYNGTAWTVLGGGAPSGAAGGDLTGTYPNPTIASNTVTVAKLSATGTASSTTFLRGDGAWQTPPTSPTGAAGGDLTGTYPNPTVANSSITSAKILDGTITNSDISSTANVAYSKLNLAGSVALTDLSATGTASSTTFLRGDNSWATPSTSPTGAAGGDLTGTYPNPTVANSSITSAKILDGTITNTDISSTAAIAYSKLNLSSSVVAGDLASSSVTIPKINASGTASSSTFLRGDGTWSTPSSSQSMVFAGTLGLPASTTPLFFNVSGGATSTNFTVVSQYWPVTCVFDAVYFETVVTGSAGTSEAITITLYVNGSSTGFSCTNNCSTVVNTPVLVSATGSVTVNAGDSIAWVLTHPSSTPPIATCKIMSHAH